MQETEEDYRVRIEIPWDGGITNDVELKTMGAIIEVFRRAKMEGITREGQARLTRYFLERLTKPPTTEGSET